MEDTDWVTDTTGADYAGGTPTLIDLEADLWNAVTVLCGQLDCDDDTS